MTALFPGPKAIILVIAIASHDPAIGFSELHAKTTGKQLVTKCNADERTADGTKDRNYCTQFIFTVANHIDSYRTQQGMAQCVPAKANDKALREIIVKRLKFDHELRTGDASTAVAEALISAFGCTSDKRGLRPANEPPPYMPSNAAPPQLAP